MKKLLLLPALGLSALTLLETSSSTAPLTQPIAASYEVDPVHSTILFRIKHMGVAWFHGRFNTFTGSFQFDEENPENSNIQLEVEAASVDTNSQGRDDHLRSPDFFNVPQYPTIRFESTAIEHEGGATYGVTGDLSYHGKTKEVSFDAEFVGAADTSRGPKAGFEAVFTIQRSDFGDTKYIEEGALGDDVRLTISLEGSKQ